MVIGNFNKVVTFLKDVPTPKGAGYKDVFEEVVTTRGYLVKGGGSRSFSFGEIQEDTTWTVYVRKQVLLDEIKTSWKVRISGDLYTVQSWEVIENRHYYYKITLTLKRA